MAEIWFGSFEMTVMPLCGSVGVDGGAVVGVAAAGWAGRTGAPDITPPPALPATAVCAWLTFALALPAVVPLCAAAGVIANPAINRADPARTELRIVDSFLMTPRPPAAA